MPNKWLGSGSFHVEESERNSRAKLLFNHSNIFLCPFLLSGKAKVRERGGNNAIIILVNSLNADVFGLPSPMALKLHINSHARRNKLPTT